MSVEARQVTMETSYLGPSPRLKLELAVYRAAADESSLALSVALRQLKISFRVLLSIIMSLKEYIID